MPTPEEMEALRKKRQARVLKLQEDIKANQPSGILAGAAKEVPGVLRDATGAAMRGVGGVVGSVAGAAREMPTVMGETYGDPVQEAYREAVGKAPLEPVRPEAPLGTPVAPAAQRVIPPLESAPAQGRVYNPSTGQYSNAPATQVAGSAILGGAAGQGGRGIYVATPAATSMADFAQQKATTNAVMQTGAGSTRESQARVRRQGELDQMARERQAVGLQKAGIQAGGAQAQAQGEQLSGMINAALAAKAEISASGGDTTDIDAQIQSLIAQYDQATGGGQAQQDTPTPAASTNDIITQAPQGTPTIPQVRESVYDEVKAGFEKAGYDPGRMTPAEQRAWAELKKLYPYLTLPKAQRV